MRVCRVKATKKIIEMQSGGETPEHLQTLLDNAVNSGFNPTEVEALFMTEAEYEGAKLLDPVYQADQAKVVADKLKIEGAKDSIKDLISKENADPTKWKIEELVAHVIGIEKILGLR